MGEISEHETRDLGDPDEAWRTLLWKLRAGRDVELHAIKPRKERRHFHAEAGDDRVKVDRAKKHRSADITSERTVTSDQFECVAERYNRYVKRITGVRPEMRDLCGQNTSYIISMIHELLLF